MFCPNCRSEYRLGFDRCAECQSPLVDSLPEQTEDSDPELLPVLQTTDPVFLPIAKSLLDSANIPYVVQGEAGVNVFPLGGAAARVTNRITGTILLVPKQHFEEAKALLEAPPDDTETL